MTTEEKARAYDEALEKAKELIKKGYNVLMPEIFPKLKESEDERMWKLLKKYVHCNISDMVLEHDHTTREELESWLEKQKPAAKVESFADEFNTEFQKQVANIIASVLNKEHEYSKGYIEWIAQSLLGYAKNEIKPAEWSEEDEKMYQSALWHIKNSCGNGGKNSGEFEVYNWVKSLRPQPKQEWGEEDDAKWYGVIETEEYMLQVVRGAQKFDVGNKEIERQCEEELDWLKSLRPQKQWKPSDAQMEALKLAYEDAFEVPESCVPHLPLKSLYNDLKQL